jgi:hypothetical protein
VSYREDETLMRMVGSRWGGQSQTRVWGLKLQALHWRAVVDQSDSTLVA